MHDNIQNFECTYEKDKYHTKEEAEKALESTQMNIAFYSGDRREQ